MSLPSELTDWLIRRQKQRCHRALVVLSGNRYEMLCTAKAILEFLEPENGLWMGVGDDAISNQVKIISNKQYRQYLGTEHAIVVYDCFQGFRASAVSALSGSVRRGGLMIMLCPALDIWPSFDDPEKLQRISVGFLNQATTSHYFTRLGNIIKGSVSVALLHSRTWRLPLEQVPDSHHLIKAPFKSCDQALAVSAIREQLSALKQSSLVLTAHRGRGKSASLGIAAAQWLLENSDGDDNQIAITASHPRSCEQIFAHASSLLSSPDRQKHTLLVEQGCIRFIPFDVLLSEQPKAHALFIDEAASIPADILARLAAIYRRVVFATTVHGYEGSGRGFEIRFKQQLQQLRPETQYIHLHHPIRWDNDDPLEQFWFSACLLDAESSALAASLDDIKTVELSRHMLSNDEALLRSVFGLLVEAHYQTTPDDLQRMLDGPEHRIFATLNGDRVAAIALVVEEPPHLHNIAPEIVAGRRRPNGYLLAQSLAIHNQDTRYLAKHFWRIIRIATHENVRQQGLGSQLLTYISNVAQYEGVDAVGTSFGMTESLVAFWQSNGFQLVKTGYKRDASSGQINGLFLKRFATNQDPL